MSRYVVVTDSRLCIIDRLLGDSKYKIAIHKVNPLDIGLLTQLRVGPGVVLLFY